MYGKRGWPITDSYSEYEARRTGLYKAHELTRVAIKSFEPAVKIRSHLGKEIVIQLQ